MSRTYLKKAMQLKPALRRVWTAAMLWVADMDCIAFRVVWACIAHEGNEKGSCDTKRSSVSCHLTVTYIFKVELVQAVDINSGQCQRARLSVHQTLRYVSAFLACGKDFSWQRRRKYRRPSAVLYPLCFLLGRSKEQIWFLQFVGGDAWSEESKNEPVTVNEMVILKVSPSITWAPELEPMGDSRLVIAWMPCSVPARTRYSFEVSCANPSAASC